MLVVPTCRRAHRKAGQCDPRNIRHSETSEDPDLVFFPTFHLHARQRKVIECDFVFLFFGRGLQVKEGLEGLKASSEQTVAEHGKDSSEARTHVNMHGMHTLLKKKSFFFLCSIFRRNTTCMLAAYALSRSNQSN